MVFMKVEPIVLKTGLDQLVQPPASDSSGPVWKEVEPGIELVEPAVQPANRTVQLLLLLLLLFYSIKTTFQPSPLATSLGAAHCLRHGAATGQTSLPQRHSVTAKCPHHTLLQCCEALPRRHQL